MRPLLACGQCVDENLFSVFPFLFYWIILFVAWSLLLGPILSVVSRLKKERLPPLPHHYFFLALGMTILLAPLTMGAVGTGFAVGTSIGLFRMARHYRRSHDCLSELTDLGKSARKMQRLVLTTCALLVPVAYVRLWLQLH